MPRSQSSQIRLFIVGTIALVVSWWFGRPSPRTETPVPSGLPVISATKPGLASRLPGDEILAEFGTSTSSPEHDLVLVSRVLDGFSLLVKGDNPLPLGSNEEMTAALRGKNAAALQFLSADNPRVDAAGRLVDRWNHALYFHAESRSRIEIRSAGPDGKMWTADDIHRRADGSFLRGDALLSPSLHSISR